MIDTNLCGYLHTVSAVLPGMIAPRSGHILNLSSVAGIRVGDASGVYSATKFFIRGITDSLRQEVGIAHGIQVSMVSPGVIDTGRADKVSNAEGKQIAQDLDAGAIHPDRVADAVVHALDQPTDVTVTTSSSTPPARTGNPPPAPHRTGAPLMISTASHRPLALVTGASAGIGYELAKLFAINGYDLITTGRSEHTDHAAADLARHGVHVTPARADLSQGEGVETVWRAVEATGGPLDAAVLNAGRSIGGAFLDTDLDDELSLIRLNVASVVHLAKHVARHMADNGRGRILITSSLSATLPTPYETVYGPSRAFTRMFALGLREELKEHGVTVICLMTGATDSNFHANAGMNNTAFGPDMEKNSRKEVARQGFLALMNGRAEIVGGDVATKRTAVEHRFLPETYKAARHATKAKPRS